MHNIFKTPLRKNSFNSIVATGENICHISLANITPAATGKNICDISLANITPAATGENICHIHWRTLRRRPRARIIRVTVTDWNFCYFSPLPAIFCQKSAKIFNWACTPQSMTPNRLSYIIAFDLAHLCLASTHWAASPNWSIEGKKIPVNVLKEKKTWKRCDYESVAAWSDNIPLFSRKCLSTQLQPGWVTQLKYYLQLVSNEVVYLSKHRIHYAKLISYCLGPARHQLNVPLLLWFFCELIHLHE